MIYLDSETVGFTGPMVLLQYAEDDGEIILHEIFHEPIEKTIELIEYICTQDVCGFNLVFDWFHLTKIYNILKVLHAGGYRGLPSEQVVADIEAMNPSEFCLRPKSALDLMLAARRGKYQYVMNRKSISIRRVPEIAAEKLAEVLRQEINLPEICFSKSSEGYRWKTRPSKDYETEKELPGLKDVYLDFSGSTSLRALGSDILGEDKADWPIPKYMKPTERAWLPYGQHGETPWRFVISDHIGQWHANEQARYYAWKDVDLTRKLHKVGFPEEKGGDTDSELACALGATRWRGFEIDHDRVRELLPKYLQMAKAAPRAPEAVQRWLEPHLSKAEKLVFKNTEKVTLEALIKHTPNEELRRRCELVLEARKGRYRFTLLSRLLEAPRFHPEFKVIGTKSNRQSGGGEEDSGKSGSINPQGIPRDKEIRSCFVFAREYEELWGGDADSYEVSIMAAVFPDEALNADLLTGKSFHALMGEIWYNIDYEGMMLEKSKKDDPDNKYNKVKGGDFALLFGAETKKLGDVLGLEEDETAEAQQRGYAKYPDLFRQREELAMSFCSMRQPGGLGTEVQWHEPAEYIESVLGFRRYFNLENEICRVLFRLANNPPEEIRADTKIKNARVVRRVERGTQSALGAIQSALYAAAFGLQATNMRAACNHVIQSPGGEITKEFQLALWKEQPVGVHSWRVRVYNMHDELLTVTDGTVDTRNIKERVVERFKKVIPLLVWEWDKMKTWGDK